MKRHIVLVGLPGSGKSSVGRLVAAELGAPFVDLDDRIVSRAGRSIAWIFAERGEAAFRAFEQEAGLDVLRGPPVVLAPGGGFILQPRLRARARASGVVIYLDTSPETAAERLGEAAGDRPLLQGGAAAERLAQLLRERERSYLSAGWRVRTDGRIAADVAADVVKLARVQGGW